jgi:hypothetical protein
MNIFKTTCVPIWLLSVAIALAFHGHAIGQVQQGLPSQTKPDFSFSTSDDLKRDALQKRGINDPKDPKTPVDPLKPQTTELKRLKDLNKNKDAQNKSSASSTSCFNCGTIISVTESRKKAKPVWMSTTDTNDATNSEQAAKNAEKTAEKNDNKTSDEFLKSTTGAVSMRGTLSKPDTGITLQRKLGFETLIKMDDGTMKTVTSALQPAYNIGAKVRVIGNSLSPK